MVAIARGRRAAFPALAGLAAGAAAAAGRRVHLGRWLVRARSRWRSSCWSSPLATGGVFAAMILGHWYLVTPKLPEAPLVLISRRLLWVVGLQVLLFVGWVGFGVGPGAGGAAGGEGPFGALGGPWALFVWLRLVVGLVFPLVVSWAAVQTATLALDGIRHGPAVHQRRRDRVRARSSPPACTSARGSSSDGAAAAPPHPGPPVRDAARGRRHARAAPRGAGGLHRRRRVDGRGRGRAGPGARAVARCGSPSTAATRTRTRCSTTATRSPASRP